MSAVTRAGMDSTLTLAQYFTYGIGAGGVALGGGVYVFIRYLLNMILFKLKEGGHINDPEFKKQMIEEARKYDMENMRDEDLFTLEQLRQELDDRLSRKTKRLILQYLNNNGNNSDLLELLEGFKTEDFSEEDIQEQLQSE
jgi:hypothetical protein